MICHGCHQDKDAASFPRAGRGLSSICFACVTRTWVCGLCEIPLQPYNRQPGYRRCRACHAIIHIAQRAEKRRARRQEALA